MPTTKTFPTKIRRTSYRIHNGRCDKGHFSITGDVSFGSRLLANSSLATTITYGDNHHDWRQRVRNGSNATTDLTVYTLNYVPEKSSGAHFEVLSKCRSGSNPNSCVPITGAVSGFRCVGDFTNVGYPSTDPDTLDVSDANNIALGLLYKHINQRNRMFQGGVVLGELHKTLHMIRHPARALRHQIENTYKYVKKRANGIRKDLRREFVSDTYLEAMFGWAPFFSDIKSGAEALAEIGYREHLYHQYVSGDSKDQITPINDSGYGGSPVLLSGSTQIAVNRRIVNSSYVRVKYYGKLAIEPRDRLYMKTELLGFNPRSWLPTVWELTPYSFLIDYFVNIGQVIDAWTTNTSNLVWCSKTVTSAFRNEGFVRMDKSWIAAQENAPCAGFSVVKNNSGSLCLDRKRILRKADVLGQVRSSMPSIQFKIPGMGLKWLNIAALGVQRKRIQLLTG